jgi:transposase-like protein
MSATFSSLYDLMQAIPDEQAAIDHFTAIRWRDGKFCPYCGNSRVYTFSDRRTHKCAECRKRFSIKVGTVFEDTKIPICKWLMALWLIASHKKGIASTQLAKDIKVTQKTAWFMLHRLRHAAATKSFNAPLKGTVEADETFVGGKEKNKHASKRNGDTKGGKGKAVVFGMLERDGELRAAQVPDLKGGNVKTVIQEHVEPGSTVMTDEHRSFRGLGRRYDHQTVNHSAGEYVRGDAHTNGIEGAWSLLKRQIYGIYHWVSDKHLSRYVDEMTWRYNRRKLGEGDRVNDMIAGSEGRLTYPELIA